MSGWTEPDLTLIGDTDEVQVSSHRPDGSLRPAATIWAVRLRDAVYVRSAYGPDNGWFRRAAAAGTGRLGVGGRGWNVTYQAPDPADAALHADLDAAYHAKYDRYGPRIVGSVVGPALAGATLRVSPSHLTNEHQ